MKLPLPKKNRNKKLSSETEEKTRNSAKSPRMKYHWTKLSVVQARPQALASNCFALTTCNVQSHDMNQRRAKLFLSSFARKNENTERREGIDSPDSLFRTVKGS